MISSNTTCARPTVTDWLLRSFRKPLAISLLSVGSSAHLPPTAYAGHIIPRSSALVACEQMSTVLPAIIQAYPTILTEAGSRADSKLLESLSAVKQQLDTHHTDTIPLPILEAIYTTLGEPQQVDLSNLFLLLLKKLDIPPHVIHQTTQAYSTPFFPRQIPYAKHQRALYFVSLLLEKNTQDTSSHHLLGMVKEQTERADSRATWITLERLLAMRNKILTVAQHAALVKHIQTRRRKKATDKHMSPAFNALLKRLGIPPSYRHLFLDPTKVRYNKKKAQLEVRVVASKLDILRYTHETMIIKLQRRAATKRSPATWLKARAKRFLQKRMHQEAPMPYSLKRYIVCHQGVDKMHCRAYYRDHDHYYTFKQGEQYAITRETFLRSSKEARFCFYEKEKAGHATERSDTRPIAALLLSPILLFIMYCVLATDDAPLLQKLTHAAHNNIPIPPQPLKNGGLYNFEINKSGAYFGNMCWLNSGIHLLQWMIRSCPDWLADEHNNDAQDERTLKRRRVLRKILQKLNNLESSPATTEPITIEDYTELVDAMHGVGYDTQSHSNGLFHDNSQQDVHKDFLANVFNGINNPADAKAIAFKMEHYVSYGYKQGDDDKEKEEETNRTVVENPPVLSIRMREGKEKTMQELIDLEFAPTELTDYKIALEDFNAALFPTLKKDNQGQITPELNPTYAYLDALVGNKNIEQHLVGEQAQDLGSFYDTYKASIVHTQAGKFYSLKIKPTWVKKNNHPMASKEVALIHLKRYVQAQNEAGMWIQDKNDSPVAAPEKIQLDVREEHGKKSFELQAFAMQTPGGGLHSGHYVFYGKGERGAWKRYSDAAVSPVTESEALEAARAGYVFFYAREKVATQA